MDDETNGLDKYALMRNVNSYIIHENFLALSRVVDELNKESTERPIIRPAFKLVRKAMLELVRTTRAI